MRKLFLLSLLTLACAPAVAQAGPITLDCTLGCANQTFGGAIWSTAAAQSSGSGVFEPFVRLQNKGTEDGHNTDGALSNNEKNGVHTHSVLMADLDNLAVIDNHLYYEFALDLDEPSQKGKKLDPQSLISLDQLKICSADAKDLTQVDDCPTPATYSLDLLADRSVLLDYNYLGNGNGGSDLFVYIPYAYLQNQKKYFYLYSDFGHQPGYGSEASFEEWAYRSRPRVNVCDFTECEPTPTCANGSLPPCETVSEVPEPASLLLVGTGVALGGKIRSRRKKSK